MVFDSIASMVLIGIAILMATAGGVFLAKATEPSDLVSTVAATFLIGGSFAVGFAPWLF